MKEHCKDLEQEESEIIRVVRRWNFIRTKLNVLTQKLKGLNGERENNLKIMHLKSWLTEAENFLKSHCREERTNQEIMKIKVSEDVFVVKTGIRQS